MAEAFATLSIAANVAQFIEYALALISDCREIYESTDGAKQGNLELETVIQSIQDRHARIKAACSSSNGQALPKPILKLVQACEPRIKSLIGILEEIKATKKSRFPKLGSLRAAIVASCYGNTLCGLKKRLLVIEEEVSREMINVLNDKQSRMAMSLDRLRETSQEGCERIESRLNSAKAEVKKNQEHLSRTMSHSNSKAFASVVSKVEELLQEVKEVEKDQTFLNSFGFEDLREREHRIKDAGTKTLDWIFEQQETNYMDWLTSKNDVYWIQGKAGSGKSTLMKYVCQHDSTKKALEQWAGACHLVTAQFFFWNPGLQMQKSQRGLLQSLLYQILSSCQSLIKLVRPENSPTHWTVKELFDLICKVVSQGTSTTKFCFFIDGLDEYEGDIEDIVSAVKTLGSLPTVKLCISSRPWNQFVAAFDRKGYTLVLQYFTKEDMVNYAKQEFLKDTIFRKLSDANPKFHQLSAMIATKAEGVWLWVFLVTRNLLSELSDCDTFEHVEEMLESLPGELEDYYDRILDRLNPVDRIEADRIFLITLDAAKPLPVSALPWIAKSYQDPWFAIYSPIQPISTTEIDQTHASWRTSLGNRCGDLLEIHEYSSNVPLFHHRVDFLHRTVRDHLMATYQHKLLKRVPDDFKTNRILCRIMLRLLKGLDVDPDEVELRISGILSVVDEFLYYTQELDLVGEVDHSLVDEVDLTVSEYYQKRSNHWTNSRPPSQGQYWEEFGQCTFYALAIQSKLSGYVIAKLDANPELLKNKSGRSLLDYALRPTRVVDSDLPYDAQSRKSLISTETKIIKAFLDRGVDINQNTCLYHDACGGTTRTQSLWSLFLLFCYQNYEKAHPTVLQSWYRTTELLILHDASPHAGVMIPAQTFSGSRTLTVAEVLAAVFPAFKARALIQCMVDSHRKKCRTSWLYWAWWNWSLSSWETVQMEALKPKDKIAARPQIRDTHRFNLPQRQNRMVVPFPKRRTAGAGPCIRIPLPKDPGTGLFDDFQGSSFF
ncbi:hypothetical protein NM208_g8717 [Fusarium decemcellulare]|uniref:Uncharacterized protein n=1 Tax=Fusarium decemcellulare TaxID=57161 RepID=A0ACC1S4A5_9HYPO|nr:hypothetical protein NM208_g8717 [Fusarium decemcellulare]